MRFGGGQLALRSRSVAPGFAALYGGDLTHQKGKREHYGCGCPCANEHTLMKDRGAVADQLAFEQRTGRSRMPVDGRGLEGAAFGCYVTLFWHVRPTRVGQAPRCGARKGSSTAAVRSQLPQRGGRIADDYLDAAVLLPAGGGIIACHRVALAPARCGEPQ
jgi:hypothetical protein